MHKGRHESDKSHAIIWLHHLTHCFFFRGTGWAGPTWPKRVSCSVPRTTRRLIWWPGKTDSPKAMGRRHTVLLQSSGRALGLGVWDLRAREGGRFQGAYWENIEETHGTCGTCAWSTFLRPRIKPLVALCNIFKIVLYCGLTSWATTKNSEFSWCPRPISTASAIFLRYLATWTMYRPGISG